MTPLKELRVKYQPNMSIHKILQQKTSSITNTQLYIQQVALSCHACIQILELSNNNANDRKHRGGGREQRNGKIINSFLLGARVFHSSINFSRTFENSALYKGQ